VVVFLRAFEQVEDHESRHLLEIRLARQPDLLEVAFRSFVHLEPVHCDKHAILLYPDPERISKWAAVAIILRRIQQATTSAFATCCHISALSHHPRQGDMHMDKDVKDRRKAPLQTPTDLGSNASRDITAALNTLLADVFALYLKTKNFHWHASGPHFRDYHLMFDEQADQIFATTDDIAERVRKVGGLTLHSIGEIARLKRIPDNDADYVDPLDMLAELRSDNQALITALREAHALCDDENDVATASLIENWIDQAERRVWFLYETARRGAPGH
jgi:starvation-inducible DNA-binding protein